MLKYVSSVLAEDSAVHEAVEEVGDLIETAGSKAGSMLNLLPKLTTRLLLAGLAIFVGCILIRLGKKMIESIIRMRGQRGARTEQQVQHTVREFARHAAYPAHEQVGVRRAARAHGPLDQLVGAVNVHARPR